ncbi:MAG: mannose-6-phosphate isomerase, class I, partial [Terrimesophilobacter sp.]
VYPGDPGIICALLLNRVTLRKGEALFLPAGNIHAYLEGVGIEVMSASDNVLRGGLTHKHVDLAELLRVLDFTPGLPPRLRGESTTFGVTRYRPDVEDFTLAHVTSDAELLLTGPSIALCVSGTMGLSGEHSSMSLSRGEAVFISPDERSVAVKGSGELFVATTP